VDTFWGPGFAVVAVATWMHQQGVGVEPRKAVLVGLTTLWALRLGCHVYWRSRGQGEDPRYAAFRKKAVGNEHLFLLRHVFYKQGLAIWITSLPVQIGQFWLKPEALGPAAWLGIAVCTLGFLFETVGDWQLARFKADPANRGKIMQSGLWRYTRHPNYFGDSCVWWGLFLIACDHWLGLLLVFAPLRMTHSLVNRTGKKLLEKKMRRERPEYDEYVKKTSGFFPWKPRA
jgi:steroid 5-alpha reductase family enzyme